MRTRHAPQTQRRNQRKTPKPVIVKAIRIVLEDPKPVASALAQANLSDSLDFWPSQATTPRDTFSNYTPSEAIPASPAFWLVKFLDPFSFIF